MQARSSGGVEVVEQVGEELRLLVLVWWVAWSRWRMRTGTNSGPVSKKPQRSQIGSWMQSRAAGRVQ